MKKILSILIISAAASAFAGCSEDTDYRYRAPGDNIYFNFADTAKRNYLVSFALYPDMADSVILVPVKISGERVAYDRTFKVQVDASKTSAQADLHYKPLEASYTVPAGQGEVKLPVTIYNTDPAMETTTFSLGIQLVASDDFGVNLPMMISTKISFSNRLEQPSWWQYWSGDLGAYSRTRHALFIIACGPVNLNIPSDPEWGMGSMRTLSYVKMFKSFISDPVSWIGRNQEYAMDLQPDGTYHFYNKSNPAKMYVYKQVVGLSIFGFVDEKGMPIYYL